MSSTNPWEPYSASPEVATIPPVEVLPPPPRPRQRLWVHVLLFSLTVGSTVFASGWGSGVHELQRGADALRVVSAVIRAGWLFSASLLSILLAHEFGHYFTAKYYRVPVSLPYFIPFPFSLFGTFGAFIRMSPRIPHRRALFDIAAAGPLAGLVLAIPLSYVGISVSDLIPKNALPPDVITLSEPLFFRYLGWLAYGNLSDKVDLLLHPVAFAGWAGMFITALNLLPIGQLDGGHISHALFGSRSRIVAGSFFGGLAVYSLIQRNVTWLPLLILLFFFGIQHPRMTDDGRPLGRRRQVLGIVLGVVFVGCFSLVPIRF